MTDSAEFWHLRPSLKEFSAVCVNSMFTVQSVDEERVRQAIVAIYASMNLPAPEIAFLESPWQLEKALAHIGPTRISRINASGHLWRTLQRVQPTILSSESPDLLSYCHSFLKGPVRIPRSNANRPDGLAGIADHLKSVALAPTTPAESTALFERLHEVVRARFKNVDGVSRYRRPSKEIESDWINWDLNPIDFVFAWDLIEQAAFTRFAVDYLEAPLSQGELDLVTPIFELAEQGHAYHFFKELCLCSSRPSLIQTDDLGRLHSVQTPALSYRDGIKRFAWHGVRVPEYAVSNRVPWSPIHWETNAEVMQVLIERFGEAKFLEEIGAMIVDRSEFGTLYWQFSTAAARAVLAVTNSTPELDGTFKTYFLSVPPGLLSAKEAVAWTFGLREEEYEPTVQT